MGRKSSRGAKCGGGNSKPCDSMRDRHTPGCKRKELCKKSQRKRKRGGKKRSHPAESAIKGKKGAMDRPEKIMPPEKTHRKGEEIMREERERGEDDNVDPSEKRRGKEEQVAGEAVKLTGFTQEKKANGAQGGKISHDFFSTEGRAHPFPRKKGEKKGEMAVIPSGGGGMGRNGDQARSTSRRKKKVRYSKPIYLFGRRKGGGANDRGQWDKTTAPREGEEKA